MPNLTPELITAIGAAMVAAFSIWTSWRSSKQAVKKDEMTLLRDEIARLHARVRKGEARIGLLEYLNTRLQEDVRSLREYSTTLRTMMIAQGIQNIPEMPHLHSDDPYRPVSEDLEEGDPK